MIKTKLLQIELSDIAAVTFTDILLTILTYPPAHVLQFYSWLVSTISRSSYTSHLLSSYILLIACNLSYLLTCDLVVYILDQII